MHPSTKAETLVEVGLVVVEIFSEIGRFLPYRFKVHISHTSISGITGPKFSIFVYDVEG